MKFLSNIWNLIKPQSMLKVDYTNKEQWFYICGILTLLFVSSYLIK